MLSCIPVWDDACELGRCVMFCVVAYIGLLYIYAYVLYIKGFIHVKNVLYIFITKI